MSAALTPQHVEREVNRALTRSAGKVTFSSPLPTRRFSAKDYLWTGSFTSKRNAINKAGFIWAGAFCSYAHHPFHPLPISHYSLSHPLTDTVEVDVRDLPVAVQSDVIRRFTDVLALKNQLAFKNRSICIRAHLERGEVAQALALAKELEVRADRNSAETDRLVDHIDGDASCVLQIDAHKYPRLLPFATKVAK